MTLASVLFGGGPSPYISNFVYPTSALQPSTTSSSPNKDMISPFIPRSAVTIDGVAWMRDNTNPGNVYVGIYSADGTLLTDCALDDDATAGMHVVSTTQITLLKNALYYFAWNANSDVASLAGSATGTDARPDFMSLYGASLDLASNASYQASVAYSKARTNAALVSSLTMSGWSSEINQIAMGFRVA